MDEILQRLRSWIDGVPQGPVQAQVHLTNACNLDCVFCPTRILVSPEERKREREIPPERWVSLVDEGEALGVREWHLCGGGEPLLFLNTAFPFMKRIKDRSRRGEVITNGTLIDESLAERLVDIGWDRVTVSLDGPSAQINDAMRGEGSFQRIVRGVRTLVKRRRRSRSEAPTIGLHMVICKENFRSVRDMIALANEVGVDEVLINALNLWEEQLSELALGPAEKEVLGELLPEAHEQALSLGVATNIGEFIRFDLFNKANVMDRSMGEAAEEDLGEARDGKKSSAANYVAHPLDGSPCFSPWYNLSIFADGSVKPCFMLKDEGETIRMDALEKIWRGSYFKAKREQMLSNRLTADCAQCNPWSLGKTREIRRRLTSHSSDSEEAS